MTNILTSEAILQPSQISMADHSWKNTQRPKVVNYFRRRAPLETFFWAPNTSLYLLSLTYQKKCVCTKSAAILFSNNSSWQVLYNPPFLFFPREISTYNNFCLIAFYYYYYDFILFLIHCFWYLQNVIFPFQWKMAFWTFLPFK